VTYIPTELRRVVSDRAGDCCEYCRLSRGDHVLPFEIDHIISEKHRGTTTAENLCLSCWDCNKAKGSDIAGVDVETDTLTYLFHPRKQDWDDHFFLDGGLIIPLTPEGRVTEFLLNLNADDRLQLRIELVVSSSYPCE
jgi:hypothetical protein